MRRRRLRSVAVDRLDTRVADVSAAFLDLDSRTKAELIRVAPELYFAAARMVRMREIALDI